MLFKKVTQDKYWDMLGCVPPACQTGYGFLVGEAMNHNSQGMPRFTAFVENNTGFYESVGPMTVLQFKTLKVTGPTNCGYPVQELYEFV